MAFTQLGKVAFSLSEWISNVSHVQLLDSPEAMEILPVAGRNVLHSDHIVVYRHMGDQYWAVAPMVQRNSADGGTGSAESWPQRVGRGMVGYAAMVRKDVRVADTKASSLYDVNAEDVTVVPLPHSVHPAAIARAQQPDQEEDNVLVKAMRGWQTATDPYSQDDMAMLRALANSAQQVRIFDGEGFETALAAPSVFISPVTAALLPTVP